MWNLRVTAELKNSQSLNRTNQTKKQDLEGHTEVRKSGPGAMKMMDFLDTMDPAIHWQVKLDFNLDQDFF